MLRLLTVGSIFLLLIAADSFAKDRLFGLVAKSQEDKNFIAVYEGCQEAARAYGDHCRLLGPHGPASARPQAVELRKALDSGEYSAIAISVVKSSLIAGELKKHKSIPVITFDSPFEPEDKDLSSAYVGPDNRAFGADLAKLAKRLYPAGGRLFIMGDLHDPNLAERIIGIRRELANDPDLKLPHRRLNGENGWFESPRSPWNSGDNIAESILKLDVILSQIQPDVFISVGHWPIVDDNAYHQTVSQYRFKEPGVHTAIIAGIGEITPEHDRLVSAGLLDGLVSIDFYAMGRLSYTVMRNILEKTPIQRWNYTPNRTLSGNGR